MLSCEGAGGGPLVNEPPRQLAILAGDNQHGDPSRFLGEPLRVRLTDGSGAPVRSTRITFEVSSGGGFVVEAGGSSGNPVSFVNTDATGQAAVFWSLGPDTTATQVLRISAVGVQTPVLARATSLKRIFARVVSSTGQHVKAGDTLRMVLEAYDSDGLVVPRARVTWTVVTAGTVITSADTITDTSGRASAALRAATVPGPVVVMATVRSDTLTFPNQITPADLASLVPTPADVVLPMEGNIVRLSVKGFDRFGNDMGGLGVLMTIADTTVATDWGAERVRAVEAGETRAILRSGDISIVVPVTVMSFAKVYVVDGGPCGITSEGNGYCWDRGSDTTDLTLQPSAPVAQLAYSGANFCVLTLAGAATCWGRNTLGELGGGPGVQDITRPMSAPVVVAGGLTWAQLTVSFVHACGVTSTADGYCWGFSKLLGTDSTSGVCRDGPCANQPVPIAGGLKFRSISSVRLGTCGVTTNSDGYCWGESFVGELGSQPMDLCLDGRTQCITRPQMVGGGRKWQAIVTGELHSCGLATDGETYCWGSNDLGQLGTGGVPVDSSLLPRKVVGGLRFASLVAGGYQTCGLTASGKAYCWGSRLTNVPTAVRPELSFVSIAASNTTNDIGCGLSPRGGVHCWTPPGSGLQESTFPRRSGSVSVRGLRQTPHH